MSITGSPKLDKEDLRNTIADVIDRDVEDVQDTTLFMADLNVDSLIALEVLVVLERRYGVKLEESQLRDITCLQRAYEVISEKMGES